MVFILLLWCFIYGYKINSSILLQMSFHSITFAIYDQTYEFYIYRISFQSTGLCLYLPHNIKFCLHLDYVCRYHFCRNLFSFNGWNMRLVYSLRFKLLFHDLVPDCSIYIANSLEILQSCAMPSICNYVYSYIEADKMARHYIQY